MYHGAGKSRPFCRLLDLHFEVYHISPLKPHFVEEFEEIPIPPVNKYVDGIYPDLFEHEEHFPKEKPGNPFFLVFLS